MAINRTLKALTVEEAYALRRHATAEEIARLNFDTLDPGSPLRCVYGQMTGHCHNERARRLISVSAVPFTDYSILDFSGLNNIGNSERKWTALEHYIAHPYANNHTLLEFLKGVREDLTPEDL